MLWYKTWLETRSRFCIALVLCIAFCSELIIALPGNGMGRIDLMGLHAVNSALIFVWILGVTLLMMGGLLRERANGSSSFTLSLPVSRLHLMTVRMVMGLMQSVALAVLPWTAMLIIAGASRKPHYLSQAGFHVFLLLTGGGLFLSFALLLSSVIEGEYTAPILSLGTIILVAYTLSGKDLIPYSPVSFMTGLRYYSHRTSLLMGPLPWRPAAAFIAVAVCLFAVSVGVIQRRDF